MESTTPGVNPKVNYGIWVIMMCHYNVFIFDNKYTVLVNDVNNWGGYASMRVRDI